MKDPELEFTSSLQALMIVETWGVYVTGSDANEIFKSLRCYVYDTKVVYFINGTSVGIFQNATILRILRILRCRVACGD